MNLSEIPIGSCATVTKVSGDGPVSKRLMEMGVIPGIEVCVIKTAPLGDPIEISLRGYHLAVRKNEAEAIEVTR